MPPPKKHPQLNPGAPPGGSTWNLVELRLGLNLETRRTAAVDEALYTRSHAKTAFGTVADFFLEALDLSVGTSDDGTRYLKVPETSLGGSATL